MSALPVFAQPDIPYADVSARINQLESSFIASRSGDHEQIALMHQSEDDFDHSLRTPGNYVDRVANNDEAIILSAGFHLSKQPAPSEKPEFSVQYGETSGSIWLVCKRVQGAKSYVWQYAPDVEAPHESDWKFGSASTQVKYLLTGLTPASKVWFRVAAVTSDGLQTYSKPIQKVVP